MVSFQETNDQQGDESSGLYASRFYNGNLSYTLGLPSSNTNISLAVNYNQSDAPQSLSETWGPTLAVSRPFFNKQIKNNMSVSYNKTTMNDAQANNTLNLRLSSTYVFKENHNFNANLTFLSRTSTRAENAQPAFTETSVNVVYSYHF